MVASSLPADIEIDHITRRIPAVEANEVRQTAAGCPKESEAHQYSEKGFQRHSLNRRSGTLAVMPDFPFVPRVL